MKIYVARHGFSEANNRDNAGTLAFGNKYAGLEEAGITHARQLGRTLLAQYGIDLSTTPVATSTYTRAIETATEAGALLLRSDPRLDELEPDETGIPRSEIRDVIASRKFPEKVLQIVKHRLDTPPPEKVWVTHGAFIAALCILTHQDEEFEDLKPAFGEVRRINLDAIYSE